MLLLWTRERRGCEADMAVYTERGRSIRRLRPKLKAVRHRNSVSALPTLDYVNPRLSTEKILQ